MTTPDLKHLMSAYFHQDYDIFGDVMDVVDAFMAASPRRAEGVVRDIDTVLSQGLTQEQVTTLLFRLGSEVSYPPQMGGDVALLRDIRSRILERNSRNGPSSD